MTDSLHTEAQYGHRQIDELLLYSRYSCPLSSLRSLPERSGIYALHCRVDGRVYIGSAGRMRRGIRSRINCHRSKLSSGKHYNGKLQEAFLNYGIHAFQVYIIEECAVSDVLSREQAYLDRFLPFNPRFIFNSAVSASAPGLGRKIPESELRRRQRTRGLWSDEKRQSVAGKHRETMLLNHSKTDIQKRSTEACALKYEVAFNGEVFRGSNLKEFCRNQGLDYVSMTMVVAGIRPHHKGWTRAECPKIPIRLMSPAGLTFQFHNSSQFARENGLEQTGVSRLARGVRKSYKGWTKL